MEAVTGTKPTGPRFDKATQQELFELAEKFKLQLNLTYTPLALMDYYINKISMCSVNKKLTEPVKPSVTELDMMKPMEKLIPQFLTEHYEYYIKLKEYKEQQKNISSGNQQNSVYKNIPSSIVEAIKHTICKFLC